MDIFLKAQSIQFSNGIAVECEAKRRIKDGCWKGRVVSMEMGKAMDEEC